MAQRLEYCLYEKSLRDQVIAAGGEIKIPAMLFLCIDPLTGELAVQVYDDDGNGNGDFVIGVILEEGIEQAAQEGTA